MSLEEALKTNLFIEFVWQNLEKFGRRTSVLVGKIAEIKEQNDWDILIKYHNLRKERILNPNKRSKFASGTSELDMARDEALMDEIGSIKTQIRNSINQDKRLILDARKQFFIVELLYVEVLRYWHLRNELQEILNSKEKEGLQDSLRKVVHSARLLVDRLISCKLTLLKDDLGDIEMAVFLEAALTQLRSEIRLYSDYVKKNKIQLEDRHFNTVGTIPYCGIVGINAYQEAKSNFLAEQASSSPELIVPPPSPENWRKKSVLGQLVVPNVLAAAQSNKPTSNKKQKTMLEEAEVNLKLQQFSLVHH